MSSSFNTQKDFKIDIQNYQICRDNCTKLDSSANYIIAHSSNLKINSSLKIIYL